jgi:hypothetical protein
LGCAIFVLSRGLKLATPGKEDTNGFGQPATDWRAVAQPKSIRRVRLVADNVFLAFDLAHGWTGRVVNGSNEDGVFAVGPFEVKPTASRLLRLSSARQGEQMPRSRLVSCRKSYPAGRWIQTSHNHRP